MEVTDEMWGRIVWTVSTLLSHSLTNSDCVPSKFIFRDSRGLTSGSSLTKNLLEFVQVMSICWMKQNRGLKSVDKALFTCVHGWCSDYGINVITASIFEACLKEHKKLCPPEKTKCGASTRSILGWQREMSQAVQEMEQFSDAEGANENDGADGGGEDENGDSAEEY